MIKETATPLKKETKTGGLRIKKSKAALKSANRTSEPPVKKMKEELRKRTMITLQETFTDIKKLVGEKKFEKHIRKASKELVKGAIKNNV